MLHPRDGPLNLCFSHGHAGCTRKPAPAPSPDTSCRDPVSPIHHTHWLRSWQTPHPSQAIPRFDNLPARPLGTAIFLLYTLLPAHVLIGPFTYHWRYRPLVATRYLVQKPEHTAPRPAKILISAQRFLPRREAPHLQRHHDRLRKSMGFCSAESDFHETCMSKLTD